MERILNSCPIAISKECKSNKIDGWIRREKKVPQIAGLFKKITIKLSYECCSNSGTSS